MRAATGIHQTPKTTKSLIFNFLSLSILTGLVFHDLCRQRSANLLTTEGFSSISIKGTLREPEPEPESETPKDWENLTKTFKDNETNPKNSLKTFLVTQEHRELYPNVITTCQQKLAAEEFLCKLGYNNSCYARGPADVIGSFWAVGPMYAYDQAKNNLLYEFHNNFRDYIKSIGMPFCTIEGIRADLGQKYAVTKAGREPYEIQVTIYDENYIRENLLNVALKKIPGWEYVTWIDAHQFFDNKYWWEESIVKMEKYGAVQPFKMTERLTFDNKTLMLKQGAIALSLVQSTLDEGPTIEYGNAFTIRREMYDAIGGIIDVGIASGCDLSYVTGSIPANISFGLLYITPNYAKNFQPWIDRMREVFQGHRAIVRGTLHHLRHMKYFGYERAAEAYDKAHFNFTMDTTKDENGTIKITNPMIRQLIPNLRFSYNQGW